MISSLQKEISSLQRKSNYGKIKDKSKQIIQDYKKKPTVLPIQYDENVLLTSGNKTKLDVITEDDEGSDNVKSVKQNTQSNLLVTGENQSLNAITEEDEGSDNVKSLNAITETITRKQNRLQSLNKNLLSLKETYKKLKKSNDAYNELIEYYIETFYLVKKLYSDVDKTEKNATEKNAADINDNLTKMETLFIKIHQFYNDFNQQEQEILNHIKVNLTSS